MKKTAFALICVLLVGVFSGCSPKTLTSDQVLSVINSDGKIISIGDTEAQVTKITGTKTGDGIDFPDGATRESYVNSPGILVDYFNGEVVAIRLSGEGKWSYVGGVKPGMTKVEAEAHYSRENYPFRETGMNGGVFMAYDENKAAITYDENAPYTLRVSYKEPDDENGYPIEGAPQVVNVIAIQSNLLY